VPADLWRDVQAYARRHALLEAEALHYLLEAGVAAEDRAMLSGP
jgi:hypothetical protein